MDERLFSGFGIEIIRRLDRFYVRYDSGEIAVHMTEVEISAAEAERAQKSESDAYQVLLASQQR